MSYLQLAAKNHAIDVYLCHGIPLLLMGDSCRSSPSPVGHPQRSLHRGTLRIKHQIQFIFHLHTNFTPIASVLPSSAVSCEFLFTALLHDSYPLHQPGLSSDAYSFDLAIIPLK